MLFQCQINRFVAIKFRSRLTISLHDLLMIPAAWFGAFWLRFNLDAIPDRELSAAVNTLPLVIILQALIFRYFGLYRGVWRFSSVQDIVRIAKAVLTGVILITVSLFLYDRLYAIPRSAVPIYICLLMLFLCGPRLFYRYWKDHIAMERSGKRTLIVGAGTAGVMLLNDIYSDINCNYLPVAFVDDDRNKRRTEILGVSVIGSVRKIPKFTEALQIEMVLIAIPSATDQQMRKVIEACEISGIPFKTLPTINELLSEQVTRKILRDVSIEDVLGREPIKLDWDIIAANLGGQTIMITGGGGSIGSELCVQLSRIKPKQIIILEQSEFNLYRIDQLLNNEYPAVDFVPILGDVTNLITVQDILEKYKPDVIFHAAAYKHVPLLESQIREAVVNNLLGTKIVAEAAIAAGIKRFVLISTDKAVNPSNVMGATKRAAEVLCQNLDNPDTTRFITVRFGNVLDSDGSVVPLFRKQIKQGGPITVTHREITRFFMTIREACQLIVLAEVAGSGGEIFVLDMGEPVAITYLAEQMILLSGEQPDTDIEIKYIGLRPGEKLYEELFHQREKIQKTPYDKLLLAQARRHDDKQWAGLINALEKACRNNDDNILAILSSLVPEYQQQETSKKQNNILKLVNTN